MPELVSLLEIIKRVNPAVDSMRSLGLIPTPNLNEGSKAYFKSVISFFRRIEWASENLVKAYRLNQDGQLIENLIVDLENALAGHPLVMSPNLPEPNYMADNPTDGRTSSADTVP